MYRTRTPFWLLIYKFESIFFFHLSLRVPFASKSIECKWVIVLFIWLFINRSWFCALFSTFQFDTFDSDAEEHISHCPPLTIFYFIDSSFVPTLNTEYNGLQIANLQFAGSFFRFYYFLCWLIIRLHRRCQCRSSIVDKVDICGRCLSRLRAIWNSLISFATRCLHCNASVYCVLYSTASFSNHGIYLCFSISFFNCNLSFSFCFRFDSINSICRYPLHHKSSLISAAILTI